MKKYFLLLLAPLVLMSCNIPVSQSTATTAVPETDTPAPVMTFTPTETSTSTITLTPTETLTPTITFTPTVTATPTYAFPTVTVNKQAHCRYGPSVAYLHAADLYAGDVGTVRGRYVYSKWLYIKFDKLNYFCWVAPSVVDVVGDISLIGYKELNLQSIGSNMYGPPTGVTAVRVGNEVLISWNQVVMTDDDDRGYLLELFVCQGGNYLWWTYSYPDQFTTSYEVRDEAGCALPSSGKLYTVEKHGFSQPVILAWPPP
ncbi:MAG TPA: hypothetical protein VIS72_06455 [Anaerolineales bacterium]